MGQTGGEGKQARLRLKVQHGREAGSHRQHRFVAPGMVGFRQRGEFPGEGGGEGCPVAMRTRHGNRLEPIRLVDQPEPDRLRLVRVMRGENFGGMREVGEFA